MTVPGALLLCLAAALPAAAEDPLVLTASSERTGSVTSVVFTPDGRSLLSSTYKGIALWDAATGKQSAAWLASEEWVRSVAVSPDGRTALSGGDDGYVRLWDLASRQILGEWSTHAGAVRAVAYSPDGRKALSGGADLKLILRELPSGRELGAWKGHTWGVNSAVFSADGKRVVSGSVDLSVRVWDAASGKELGVCSGHTAEVNSVAFSPDGKTVLSGSVDNTIRLWDAASCAEKASWQGHRKWVNAVAFSPDGRTAASGSRDNSVKLWDVATGKELATWKGHINPVTAVAFSPDGSLVASGSEDQTIKLWRVPMTVLAGAEIPKPKAPPKLTARLSFSEPSGDDVLEGEETGTLRLSVENAGPGSAYALKASLGHEPVAGLTIPSSVDLGNLLAGKSVVKDISLASTDALGAGKVRIEVQVREGNGFDAQPGIIEFETRPFVSPRLEAARVALGGDGVVKAGEITEVTLTVKNRGAGPARGASAELVISNPDIFPSGDTTASLGDVGPGESKAAVFQFVVNSRFKGKTLPVSVELRESLGRFGASVPLNLALGEAAPSMTVVSVKGKETSYAQPAAASSEAEDVDSPPATRAELDPDAYAVVVGIEKYRQKGIPAVDYAARDARAVSTYLTRAMGFDEKNVALLQNEDAGKTDLEKYLGPWLANRVTPKSRVFIYYAGHGAPNPVTGEGYLVPYDGDPNYTDVAAYPLKRFYETLGKLQSKSITVVLDACFSGQGGRSQLAKGARPLVVKVDNEAAIGKNTVVLTATGGSQISTFYPEGEHGLLTYFLLKGLKGAAADKDGKVTTTSLFSYVKPMVEREAKKQNVSQTPTLSPVPEDLGDRARQVWLRAK